MKFLVSGFCLTHSLAICFINFLLKKKFFNISLFERQIYRKIFCPLSGVDLKLEAKMFLVFNAGAGFKGLSHHIRLSQTTIGGCMGSGAAGTQICAHMESQACKVWI